MSKIQLPQSSEEVRKVMKDYILQKKFNLSESAIEYIAEDCFLHFSSKEWAGVKYWPAVAMRWVLNNVTKFGERIERPSIQSEGPTLKDQILKKQQP